MKKVVVVIVLALLALLAWQIVRRVSAQAKAAPPSRRGGPVAVELAEVRRMVIRDVGQFSGSLAARSSFVVAPKIAGRLEKLSVDIGDPVRPGQEIALLDDEESAQQVEQARAEVAVARANVDEAKSNLAVTEREMARVEALKEKDIASESELDAIANDLLVRQAKLKVAEAQVLQKEAALKSAEVRLSYTRITASWDAASDAAERFVAERFADAGAMLRANDPIVSIADIRTLTAVVYVIERDYAKMRVGQPVTLTTDAHPGRVFEGRVARIAPILKESARQGRVEIEAPNPDLALKPGMFVRAGIAFEQHADVPVVPTDALVRRNGDRGVFLADLAEKKARFVPVRTGLSEGALTEIVSPALTGHVVTLGHHLLDDGGALLLPGDKPAGGKPAGSGAERPAAPRAAEGRRP